MNALREKAKGKVNRFYMKLRRDFLRSNPKCAVFGVESSQDIHHRAGRAGTLLVDIRFWLPVSRCAHDFIHADIKRAQRRGWIVSAGQWNVPPRDAESERLRVILARLRNGKE